MGLSAKLALAVLILAVVAVSIDAQGRGRGRGRGRRPPGDGEQGQGQGQDRGQNRGNGRGRPDGNQGNRPEGGNGRGRPDGNQGNRPEGGRGRPSGRPGGNGRVDVSKLGERLEWNQTTFSGAVVEEVVFFPENTTSLIAGSRGDEEAGIRPSRTLYEFGDDGALVLMRPRGPYPCFLTNTTLTFDTINAQSSQLNSSGINPASLSVVTFDGRGQRLPKEAVEAIYAESKRARFMCGRAGIVPVAQPGDLTDVEGEGTNITFLTYDQEVTLTVRDRSQGRQGGQRPGGQRPGGQRPGGQRAGGRGRGRGRPQQQ